jgi:hypothetical protein
VVIDALNVAAVCVTLETTALVPPVRSASANGAHTNAHSVAASAPARRRKFLFMVILPERFYTVLLKPRDHNIVAFHPD